MHVTAVQHVDKGFDGKFLFVDWSLLAEMHDYSAVDPAFEVDCPF